MVRINDGQIAALGAVFIYEGAQIWDSATRNSWYKRLVTENLFQNLKTSHIRTQWNKYQSEFVLRKHIGSSYYEASKD